MIDNTQRQPNITASSRLTRRRLIGGAAALGLGVGAGAWLRHSRSGAQSGSGEKRTLRLLCWPDYDDAEVTRSFREKHGVAIEADYIGANDEIFTWLRAGGIGRYDVVTPHNGIVKALVEAGLIESLNPDLVPNSEGLFPRFQWPDWVAVGGEVYGTPFLWGTSPMVYAPAHVASPPTAWLDVQSNKFKGRVVMTEDGFGHFLIWNAVLGHTDPTRVTITELNGTADLLISIKQNRAAAYVGTMNDVARLLADGTAWVSTIGWESTPQLREAKGADLRITHPRPGDYSFCDNLCLAKDAPNPDLAHAFIDHMLAPETQARLMNKLLRGTVSAQAVEHLDARVRALYTYEDLGRVFTLSPLRGFPPLQSAGNGIATYVDWVKSWERVRFAQMRASR
ncbi:MAG TPA: extracellular solute-binding protein [Thermomicrobiales bacterium]|nr:extracellular solute-binding protein [Thermomicrobiales bacterium]